MLTKVDLALNLSYLKWLSKLGFLPIKIHQATGEFAVLQGLEDSRWCMFALASQMGIAYSVMLLLFKVTRLDFTSAMRNFLIEFIFVYSFELTLCMGLWTFIKWPKISQTLCNESFKGGTIGFSTTENNKRKRNFRKYTWLELATIILPLCTLPWGMVVVAAKQMTTTFRGTSAILTILTWLNLISEFISVFMCSASIYWVLLNQILCMGHVCHTLEEHLTKLR